MAQFRATIQGQRGAMSRLGSKNSGLRVRADGWNGGVEVHANTENDRDVFAVYATSGSNGRKSGEYLGSVSADGVWTPANK
jgi:hypothetical protein